MNDQAEWGQTKQRSDGLLTRLDTEIERIDGQLGILFDKLDPILEPDPSETTEPNPPPINEAHLRVERLVSIGDSLSYINRRINL